MSERKPEWIPCDPETFAEGFWRQPATQEHADYVLSGDKSGWYWFRLPDGDLILGVYPQEGVNGTYLGTEPMRDV